MLPRVFGGINMKQKWGCFPIPGQLHQWQKAGPSGQLGKDTGTGLLSSEPVAVCRSDLQSGCSEVSS